MSERELYSGFKDEIERYIAYKVANGFSEGSFRAVLRDFDHFCYNRGITEPKFTREDADAWTERRSSEATSSHYSRVNKVKNFLEYLKLKGLPVFPPQDVLFKATDFQPHIYTDDEVRRYFRAVDTLVSARNRSEAVQLPVVFRLFYCCGTRLNETLGIRKRDVNLSDGTVRLTETKNGRERHIALGPEMLGLMRKFAQRYFYLIGDEDYIFSPGRGTRGEGSRIYDIHRTLLERAGIPYLGGGRGPRIHDWRHTFAVRSFKQLVDSGMDAYVALPILSAYLGHKTIQTTERYVRLTAGLYPYIGEQCGPGFRSDPGINHKEILNSVLNMEDRAVPGKPETGLNMNFTSYPNTESCHSHYSASGQFRKGGDR